MNSICHLQVFVYVSLLAVAMQVNSLPNLNNVHTMEIIDQVARDVQEKSERLQLMPVPKLSGSFKWDKCDGSPSLLDLSSLSVGPDPLHFPGNIDVGFAGTIKQTLDAPMQANMTLKKEITPSFWIKVPCIEGIGSCDYDDVCETLQGAVCPDPFVKYNVPCKCPFTKGTYKMQKSAFNIPVKSIPSGNYYIKYDVNYKSQRVLCVELYFTIQED